MNKQKNLQKLSKLLLGFVGYWNSVDEATNKRVKIPKPYTTIEEFRSHCAKLLTMGTRDFGGLSIAFILKHTEPKEPSSVVLEQYTLGGGVEVLLYEKGKKK